MSSPRLRVLLWITGVLSVVAISNVLGTPYSTYPSRVDAGRNGAVQPVFGRADADGSSFVNVILGAISLVPPCLLPPPPPRRRPHAAHSPGVSDPHHQRSPRRRAWYIFVVLVTGIWPAVVTTYWLYMVMHGLDSGRSVHMSPQNTVAIASTSGLLVSVLFPAYRMLYGTARSFRPGWCSRSARQC